MTRLTAASGPVAISMAEPATGRMARQPGKESSLVYQNIGTTMRPSPRADKAGRMPGGTFSGRRGDRAMSVPSASSQKRVNGT